MLEEFETANYNDEKIPTKIKKAIRDKDIPSIFLNLAQKYFDSKSNRILV